jgi:hypothetical protein
VSCIALWVLVDDLFVLLEKRAHLENVRNKLDLFVSADNAPGYNVLPLGSWLSHIFYS